MILTFADGTRVAGVLAGNRLTLDSHHTAAGTEMAEKSWILRFEDRGFRVLARA